MSALLTIYKKYNELITNSLDCSQCFSSALDSACTRFINTNAITQLPGCSQVKSAELIAKYCDLLLRKSAKNVDDTEIEEQLTQIMVIFRYPCAHREQNRTPGTHVPIGSRIGPLVPMCP